MGDIHQAKSWLIFQSALFVFKISKLFYPPYSQVIHILKITVITNLILDFNTKFNKPFKLNNILNCA